MLKLFIWSDVHCQHAEGIAFAMAESKAQAEELILAHAERDVRAYIEKVVKPMIAEGNSDAIRFNWQGRIVDQAEQRVQAFQRELLAELRRVEALGFLVIHTQPRGEYT